MSGRNATQIIRYSLALCILCSLDGFAQHTDVYAGMGYASYSHPEMKDYQKLLLSQLTQQGVKGTATEKFPAYYTYFAGFHKHFNRWSMGIELGHGSTGGRVYYEDYTGKYVGDQKLSNYYLGISPMILFHKTKKFRVMGGIKMTSTYTKARLLHSLSLGTSTTSNNATFYAINFGGQPYIMVRYYVAGGLFVQGTAGYELQSDGQLKKTDEHEVWLDNGSGKPVHLEGNGYRVGMSLGIAF